MKLRERVHENWSLTLLLALLFAAASYISKVESDARDLRCKEIMQHGTDEAKMHAAKWGPCR